MKKKILAATMALALGITSLTGCGSDSASSGNKAGTENTAGTKEDSASEATDAEKALAAEFIDRAPTQDDVVTEAVVNETIKLLKEKYQFEDVKKILVSGDTDTYVALGKGWYDALFNDSGISVEIQQSVDDNEPSLMERGELTFANRMLYPYLLDKKNGADIIAVWNSDNPPKEIITIVTKADAPYESFADLKGKKIASSAAGCPYSALMELADTQGWEKGVDFEHVNTKEYINALLANEVDAICYHPDWNISAVLLSDEAKIIDTAVDGGVYVSGGGDRVVFAPTQFVKDNPNVVHGYVKLMEVVSAYLVNNKEDAAKVQESIDRTPAEGTEFWIDSAVGTYYTNPRSLDELKENARSFSEWLVEKDENFDAPLDVENGFFAEEFFE